MAIQWGTGFQWGTDRQWGADSTIGFLGLERITFVFASGKGQSRITHGFMPTARYAETLTDTFDITDLGFATAQILVLTDTLAITESVAKTIGLNKTDTLAIVDAIARGIAWYLTDSLAITEATATKDVAKVFTDSISITDAISTALAQVLTKILTDSLTITDAISKKPILSFTETLAITESVVKAIGLNPTDTVAILETAFDTDLSGGIALAKNLFDSLSISDSLSSVANYTRALTDTFTITDAIVKATGLSVTDSLAITDSLVKAAAHVLSDELPITDQLTRTIGFILSLVDTLAIIDAIDIVGGERKEDFIKMDKSYPKRMSKDIEELLTGRIRRYKQESR